MSLSKRTLRCALCPKALATEDRFAALFHWTWLEGDLAGSAALRAYRVVHFPGSTVALRPACVPAVLTTLRGTEALRRVELLLALCEGKLRSAVATLNLLISHENY